MEISIKWNICRICLQEERKSDKSTAEAKMQQIFGDDNKLANQIYECSGVPMKPNDSLPDKICRKCISVLKYAVHFRKSCRDSNDYLQSIIQRTKSASSLFKQERNTESLVETITDDNDMDYVEDHDDIFSVGHSDGSNEEKETKPGTTIIHNKRKQNHKILQNGKKVKLIESSSGCDGKEPEYTMTECDNEYEEPEDIVDRIIIHDDEDDAAEIDEGVIEHTGEAENPITNIDVENASNAGSGAIHNDDRQDKCVEKLNKDTKTNFQNSYSHFTTLDNQRIITSIVDCDEDEGTNASGGDIDEKSSEAGLRQDVKAEETNNTLFYIIKKDKATNDDHHNDAEDYVGSDDNIDFMPLDEEDEVIHHIEENQEIDDIDNQSQVTSTVITKEEIDIEDANSNQSRNTQEIDAEYVIDGYIIDECGPNDPLLHSNVGISAKNTTNNSAFSLDGKEQQIRRGQAVFGRKKLDISSTRVPCFATNSTQQQTIICDLCGNNFTNRQLMNAHMKIHRQEKTHECELCFKRFITACNLQAHMRIHTGEKPFECKFCGRRFTDRSTHLRHERIHTNEKPFSCDHCGKAFALATTLQAHLKVHTGERPYRCEPCAKSFKLPHQLKAHQNTHLHKAVEQLCS